MACACQKCHCLLTAAPNALQRSSSTMPLMPSATRAPVASSVVHMGYGTFVVLLSSRNVFLSVLSYVTVGSCAPSPSPRQCLMLPHNITPLPPPSNNKKQMQPLLQHHGDTPPSRAKHCSSQLQLCSRADREVVVQCRHTQGAAGAYFVSTRETGEIGKPARLCLRTGALPCPRASCQCAAGAPRLPPESWRGGQTGRPGSQKSLHGSSQAAYP